MAIYSIYPTKDATIYEYQKYRNSGLDAIIEVAQLRDGNQRYSSRILMQFNDTEISNIINNYNVTNPKYNLRLYTAYASEIPYTYNIDVFAVSGSWNMGTGRFDDQPQTTNGVSWIERLGKFTSSSWMTSSYSPTSSGYYNIIPGGGNWWTITASRHSFEYEITDATIDITPIVGLWVSNSIDNDGIIIKRSDYDETYEDIDRISFFSTDTNTIFQPKLDICWDDQSYNTSSLDSGSLIGENQVVLYTPNLKTEYKNNEISRINVRARYAYPTHSYTATYMTQSYGFDMLMLPSTSYYAIKDVHTEEVIYDYSDYTKLSLDNNGNYFKLYTMGLQEERYYKLQFKVVTDESQNIYDTNLFFKVIR